MISFDVFFYSLLHVFDAVHVRYLQVYKNPYQRVVYRTYEGSPTFSSLEVQSSSPIIQDIFQAAPKYHPSIKVMCEVSILHVYHKNVEAKLGTINPSLTTVTPNLLGLEKSFIGDPDNSPLTGGCSRLRQPDAVYHVIFLIICCYYFCYNSILWRFCTYIFLSKIKRINITIENSEILSKWIKYKHIHPCNYITIQSLRMDNNEYQSTHVRTVITGTATTT